MEYYVRYLKKIRKVSDSSVKHYTQALRKISQMLVEKGKIKDSIYEVNNIDELRIIKEFIIREPDFALLDTTGHRMYSVGLNNYIKFAEGEELRGKTEALTNLDMIVPIAGKGEILIEKWIRSTIIKKQIFEIAEYKCEINPEHNTFIAQSSGKQYMEGHYAIPMKMQGKFNSSIDIYANVICLCPICHRQLHYGLTEDKKAMLYQIYDDRGERLARSGIKLSKNEFVGIAI